MSLYVGTSEAFFRGGYEIFRTVKANSHDLGVVESYETTEVINEQGRDKASDSQRIY